MLHVALHSIVSLAVLVLGGGARAQVSTAIGGKPLEPAAEVREPVVLEGFVFTPEGVPAEGAVVVTTVATTDDLDPSPCVVCTPPSGSFFPGGTTLVTCTATDASGNQSTCQFPLRVHEVRSR
jgi:hypothetical protein